MLRHFAFGSLTALLIAPAMHVAATGALPSDACARLAAIALPDTTIRSTALVAGPSFAPPGGGPALKDLPGFCRVAAVSKPAVSFEVWLPIANWNGKFQGVGNGANAGSISYPAMATALRRGYATASTDTGHATTNSRDGAWAVGHPELMIDFGYRAIHVTAEHAKRIVAAFYQKAASHSYFVSCSTGGRQALMEAQRFPDDYDGIVAGAPAANWSRFQTGGHLWVASALNKDPERYIPAGKLRLLQDAVLAACDATDGVRDGVLDDPRRCAFDPQTLVCSEGSDDASCFTPKQVAAIEDVYAGARDSAGRQIYPGYMPGAEAEGGWAAYMTGSGPRSGNHWEQADNVLKYMVFENPAWDFRSFDFDKDVAFTAAKLGQTFDAFDPDLTRFRRNGGKLLLYHGWNDPSISPLNTIDYYERVVSAIGKSGAGENAAAETQKFVRLFMAPGMLHCGGGPGPNTFDIVGALERWAEQGRAPESLIASHATSGAVDRTRPLCVYPSIAVYAGSGSTNDAANFACRTPTEAGRSGEAFERQTLNVTLVTAGSVSQQPASPAPPTGIPVEAPGFTGKTALLDTTGYSIGRRIFAPGSHNATWHMHAAGQLIFAESGHGRFQIKGQPIRELAPGDSGYIPPGTMHWHGSVPNESFTMTFVTMGAGPTTQGEPLTEDVYLGKSR